MWIKKPLSLKRTTCLNFTRMQTLQNYTKMRFKKISLIKNKY